MIPTIRITDRALRFAWRAEMGVAVLCLAVMATVVFADVAGRELFGQGIDGGQKLAVYGFALAGFLGLPLVTAQGGHLRPRVLDGVTMRWLSERSVTRLAHLPAALMSFGLAYASLMFVVEAVGFDERSPSLDIPVWWVQSVLPWAFASSGLRHLTYAVLPDLAPAENEVSG